MNRRVFLASLFAVPLAGIKFPEIPIPGTYEAITRSTYPFWTAGLRGGKSYALTQEIIYRAMQLQINNPRQCAIIKGIAIDQTPS